MLVALLVSQSRADDDDRFLERAQKVSGSYRLCADGNANSNNTNNNNNNNTTSSLADRY